MSSTTTKRKALSPDGDLFLSKADVQPLKIEDMVLQVPGTSACHFKRLKYKGCPNLSYHSATGMVHFKKGIVLIDMKRETFIREVYTHLREIKTQTGRRHFVHVISYLRWIDSNDLTVINDIYLSWELINKYMIWCAEQVKLAKMSKNSWGNRKTTIAYLLKAQGRKREADQLPSIKGVKKDIVPHKSLDLTTELKPVVQALFRAYKELLIHFDKNTTPKRHPLWDEDLVEREAAKRGLTGNKLGAHKRAFVKASQAVHPFINLVKVAMMICYMFTGINTKPLSSLKISDVSFKEIQGGRYILSSIKSRAGWQEQDNALGFSKRAKEYMGGWLEVATKMAKGNRDAPLFPHYSMNGDVDFYSNKLTPPQRTINTLLTRLGLSTITPSRFRKTKLDALYQATEDVYLVSMSANNNSRTVARSYIHGTESTHQNNLGASFDSQFNIAKGKDITEATSESKFKFADVLDNYEYQRLREGKDRSHESRTPTGIRCNDNRKGSAQIIDKLLKREGIEQIADEVACTDFLDCWDCSEHAFVAEVTDIWLMLSFKETLQQLQQTPAVNSMPEHKYTKLVMDVGGVLERFKEKSLKNYQQAEEQLKDGPHPLYSTLYSLSDLLEVFS